MSGPEAVQPPAGANTDAVQHGSGTQDGGTQGGGAQDGGMAPVAPLRLRPPRHQVSPRAIIWWTSQATLLVSFLLFPVAVAMLMLPTERGWLTALALVVLTAGVAYVLVMPQWRFRVHRWEATEDAVYTAAGWINQEWRVAPMSRIQTVDTERGPLQQLFGLSTVTVTTASAAGALRVEGLDHALAADLVEQLTQTTQATPGDAT